MSQAGSWVIQRLDLEPREQCLLSMMGMMPRHAFAGVASGLARSVPESGWEEMRRRIPELRKVA